MREPRRRDSVDLWFAMTVLAVALAAQCSADAQDVELPPPEALEARCAPDVEANRRATLEHAGDAGIWFHADVGRCMLGRLELLPEYARHVRLLEERLELSNERDALRQRAVQLAEQEADAARGALEAAVRRAREAEEAAAAWYRHPALWFAAGAVVVVVLEIVAIWGFTQLSI